jgi:MscS family membrane protein
VLLKIYDIITAHGAEVAFPTSTVHLPEAVKPAFAQPLTPVDETS